MKTQEKPAIANTPAANRPAHSIRHGLLSASIWRRETDKGSMFNVTFQRSYKVEGEDWKTSQSFGENDLLVLAFLSTKAFEWIGGQPSEPKL